MEAGISDLSTFLQILINNDLSLLQFDILCITYTTDVYIPLCSLSLISPHKTHTSRSHEKDCLPKKLAMDTYFLDFFFKNLIYLPPTHEGVRK